MWQQGGGNWPGWHNNWPGYQSNPMAQSHHGGNMPNPWSFPFPPPHPPPQFSEDNLFQAAYYSDRVDNSFSFQRFDRPPPQRPSRWDQPARERNHQKFSDHSPDPFPDHKENFRHSDNSLERPQRREEWEHKQVQNGLRDSSGDKSTRTDVEDSKKDSNSSTDKQKTSVVSNSQRDKEQSLKVKKGALLPNPSKAAERRPLYSTVASCKPGKVFLDTDGARNRNTSVIHNVNSSRGNFNRAGQAWASQNRGGSHAGRPSPSNRWNGPKCNDFGMNEEDESNEINQWLQLTKGSEAVLGRDEENANKDPLPGSEEARNNAIKEATDRLKQSLRQRKNVNLNEFLSSSDESKSDTTLHCKTKSYPKNLAQLELDASDMRAIGRANTEKTNFGPDENSDDDIIEVERPPTPVHPIIELDVSPTKDLRLQRSGLIEDSSEMINHNQDYQEKDGENQFNKVSHEPFPEDACKDASEDMGFENIPATAKLSKVLNSSKACRSTDVSPSSTNTTSVWNPSDIFSSPKQRKNSDIFHSSSRNSERMGASNVPVSPRKASDSPRTVENKVQNSPSETRRRRRSSSSTCEPLSPRNALSSPRTNRQAQPRSIAFGPGSPPFVSQNDHDSHQKKIINDLKKISQSKLKDLINNPRSGKLDCAMRELMKQHRAVLSRKSRDVAEKLIPAEQLNPKSTDLPPEDSSFLADFAIDWSSLPGELISTLGDLFHDMSSETLTVPGSRDSQGPNELNNVADTLITSALKVEQVNTDTLQSCGDTEENMDFAQPARIRVCQFARENVFSSESPSDIQSPQNVSENTNATLSPTHQDSSKSDTTSEDKNVVAPVATKHVTCDTFNVKKQDQQTISRSVANNLASDRNSQENFPEPVRKSNEKTVDLHNCPEKESLPVGSSVHEDHQSQQTLNEVSFATKNNTTNISDHSVNVGKASRHQAPNGKSKEKQCQALRPKQRGKKKAKKSKKFVHLEERNWFGNSSPERNQPSHSQTSNTETCHSNEPSSCDTSIISDVSVVSDSSQAQNVVYSELSGNAVEELPCLSTVPMEKQCLSMLPVLMMTVPANGISGTVCNMTPAEMEKRMTEIDAELQNLVQERFLLSQALKASQSLQGDVNKGQNESGTSQVNPSELECSVINHETSLGSGNSSAVSMNVEISKKQSLVKVNGIGLKDVSTPTTNVRPGKRKKVQCDSISDAVVEPKKKQQKISPQKTIETRKSAEPNADKNKKCQKDAELIVLAEKVDDYSTMEAKDAIVTNFVSSSPNYIMYPETSGNILDIKIVDKNVFACSHEGPVYWFTRGAGLQSQAVFGTKNGIGVICLEIVDMKCLYAGGSDGALQLFDLPTTLPCLKNVIPKSTFTVSSAIHCMTYQWDTLYLGTKAGSVVPFYTKKACLGEPLNLGGYPVLVIKCCLEGPRKVLVVACRHQPISIRDATSGLLLRSLGSSDWTVYSIVFHKNLVYCGANTDKISVFDFQTGDLKKTLTAGKGIIDMSLCNDYLFSGCYDGKIYVHNLKINISLGAFAGPGNMVLRLGLGYSNKKIFCSIKDHGMGYFQIPRPMQHVLNNTKSNRKSR